MNLRLFHEVESKSPGFSDNCIYYHRRKVGKTEFAT